MLWLLACAADPAPSDTALAVDPPDDVQMNDEESGMQVDVIGGSAPGWLFGAVWPARDMTNEGCVSDTDVCHTLEATGGFFDLDTCDVPSDDVSCIPADYYRGGNMSFLLKPSIGTGCWAWGPEASYFDPLGCDVTDWANDSY